MSHFVLFQIIGANLISIVVSLLVATVAGVWLHNKGTQHLVSLAAGALLAMALLRLLPEAQEGLSEQGLSHDSLFTFLLIGLIGFFLLEKLSLFRHNHHHEHDGHDHHHGFDKQEAGRGGWMILVGSGVHNFADGLLIAAAFLTDVRLGWLTALSIGLHEIMHKLSDFAVLLNAGFARGRALAYTLTCGLMAALGGVLGFYVLSGFEYFVPYVLVVSASSFLYIAVADLIPQINAHKGLREGLTQTAMLLCGVALVWFLSPAHQHSHHDTESHDDLQPYALVWSRSVM
jgi:zinc and cadmium transporter